MPEFLKNNMFNSKLGPYRFNFAIREFKLNFELEPLASEKAGARLTSFSNTIQNRLKYKINQLISVNFFVADFQSGYPQILKTEQDS